MGWVGRVAATVMLLLPSLVVAQDPVPGPGEERAAALAMQAQSKLASDPDLALTLLDEALDLAPRPTPFRGMIACMRGSAMRDMPEQDAQAREAFAECRRLLPDNQVAKASHATFLLFHDFKNDDDLRQGTDLLLNVMTQDPRMARQIPNSLFEALLRRLGYLGDDARIARVTEVMLKQDFLAAPALDNDRLILTGVIAALNEGNPGLAIELVPLLKRPRSLDALSASLAAKPLWDIVANYRKSGLSYRLADYDRSTKIALDAEPLDALPARITALGALGRPEEIYALITDQLDAASLAGNGWEDREVSVAAATRELFSAGMPEQGLKVGNAYLDGLDREQFQAAVDIAFNQGFRAIEFGHRKEGLAMLEKARRAWELDISTTEGKGGELNGLALASCDTTSSRANAAFAQVRSKKAINLDAYETALRCRGDIPALAAHVIEGISGKLTLSNLTQTGDLRRIEAGLSLGGSLSDRALLSRSDVQAALARVSVPLEKSAKP